MAITKRDLSLGIIKNIKAAVNNALNGVLAAGSVSASELASNSVTTAKITDANVTTAKLAAGGVTAAKAAVFCSTEQTGTGSAQNVAHGLGVVPSVVMIAPTELAADLAAGYGCAEGTHTTTNVVVTVTTGAKFKVFAWA